MKFVFRIRNVLKLLCRIRRAFLLIGKEIDLLRRVLSDFNSVNFFIVLSQVQQRINIFCIVLGILYSPKLFVMYFFVKQLLTYGNKDTYKALFHIFLFWKCRYLLMYYELSINNPINANIASFSSVLISSCHLNSLLRVQIRGGVPLLLMMTQQLCFMGPPCFSSFVSYPVCGLPGGSAVKNPPAMQETPEAGSLFRSLG